MRESPALKALSKSPAHLDNGSQSAASTAIKPIRDDSSCWTRIASTFIVCASTPWLRKGSIRPISEFLYPNFGGSPDLKDAGRGDILSHSGAGCRFGGVFPVS